MPSPKGNLDTEVHAHGEDATEDWNYSAMNQEPSRRWKSDPELTFSLQKKCGPKSTVLNFRPLEARENWFLTFQVTLFLVPVCSSWGDLILQRSEHFACRSPWPTGTHAVVFI